MPILGEQAGVDIGNDRVLSLYAGGRSSNGESFRTASILDHRVLTWLKRLESHPPARLTARLRIILLRFREHYPVTIYPRTEGDQVIRRTTR